MNWFKQLFSRDRVYNDLSDGIQQHLEENVGGHDFFDRRVFRTGQEASLLISALANLASVSLLELSGGCTRPGR